MNQNHTLHPRLNDLLLSALALVPLPWVEPPGHSRLKSASNKFPYLTIERSIATIRCGGKERERAL